MATGTPTIWALVMNGARARILRGIGDTDDQSPIELVMKSEARNLRGLLSETRQPTSTVKAAGQRAAPLTENGPIAEDQREFIRQVIALLESHRRGGECDRRGVCAAPDALARLHSLMPESLHHLVQCEAPKNLLHLPENELRRVIMHELDTGRTLF